MSGTPLTAPRVKLIWKHKDDGEQTAIADLVLAADGASSTIRKLLVPEVERKYVGYVAWRGTVPETELSPRAREVLIDKFTFYHTDGYKTKVQIPRTFETAADPTALGFTEYKS